MSTRAAAGGTSFLFTDVEGSTRLWDRYPDEMSKALERHDEIMHATFGRFDGTVFSAAGDSFGAAFTDLASTCMAAVAIQRELAETAWPGETPIRVRMGIHLGVAEFRGGYYFGPAVNRAARIMTAAHGGQTVLSDRVAALVRADYSLLDLGRQHLKDLDEPERIWQLGEGAHPPLRSVRGKDVRLPEPTSRLVGRDEDENALIEMVSRSRLVGIVGPGGMGKTRVALAVASRMLPEFPAGAVFADLSEVVGDDDVADAVASAVGVRLAPSRSITETLIDWYRESNALLVLDNCDLVLDGVAVLVDQLLSKCSEIHILATSRTRVGSPQAVWYSLEPIDRLASQELLVERIRDLDPAFNPNLHSDDLEALAERLDGIPLAVELAAARCRGLTPGELVARLDRGPESLTDPQRTDRQRSVEATISGSIEALTDMQQLVFARSSVFAGQFDLAAAESVVGNAPLARADVADALVALVDASLLQRRPSGSYRMLTPLRDVARTRIAADDDAPLHHGRYFRDLAVRIGQGVQGADEAIWADIARTQFGNFRVAWEAALERGDIESVGDIVFGLWRHAFDRAQFEVLRWSEEALRLVDDDTPPSAVAACLAAAAPCYLHLGRFDDLHRAVERMDGLGEAALSYRPVAYAMRVVASANQGDPGGVERFTKVTLVAAEESGDEWIITMCHIFLHEFDTAIPRCRSQLNPSLWSWFHIFRGFSRLADARLAAAEDDFAQGGIAAREVGNTQALGVARNEVGTVIARSEERPLADMLDPLDQALEIFLRLRTPYQLWNSLEVLAQAFARRGFLEPAVVLWSAIDAEEVTPPSAQQRGELAAVDRGRYREAVDAGMAMDLWQAADFGRRFIVELLGAPATESTGASSE